MSTNTTNLWGCKLFSYQEAAALMQDVFTTTRVIDRPKQKHVYKMYFHFIQISISQGFLNFKKEELQ